MRFQWMDEPLFDRTASSIPWSRLPFKVDPSFLLGFSLVPLLSARLVMILGLFGRSSSSVWVSPPLSSPEPRRYGWTGRQAGGHRVLPDRSRIESGRLNPQELLLLLLLDLTTVYADALRRVNVSCWQHS